MPRRFQAVFMGALALLLGGAPFARAAGPAGALAPPPLAALERARMQVLLKGTVQALREHYYDAALGGHDLAALEAQARDRIAQADTYDRALAAIADMTLQLGDSHTHFYPPSQTLRSHYGWSWLPVGEQAYVDLVVAGSDADRQGVHRGDRVESINGFQPGRGNWFELQYLFRGLRPQPGLHVVLVTPAGERRELDLAAQLEKRRSHFDVSRADSMDLDELYRESERYSGQAAAVLPLGEQAILVRLATFNLDPDRLVDLLREIHGRPVAILDLRGNGGGSIDTLSALYGAFCARDTNIATRMERGKATPLVAHGSGDKAYAGRLFVLVDAGSASSSELLARTVQLQERGTVIGDRTAGAVMLSMIYPVDASHGESIVRAALQVTRADLVMPDGGRLEKRGVLPDFEVLPSADDLASGRDPALALALKFAGHEVSAEEAGAIAASVRARERRSDD